MSDVDSSFMTNPMLGNESGRRTKPANIDIPTQNASLTSSFFNLTNTIVGSGMLSLPYAFAASGWVLGSFLLVICGLASAFALHLLSLCAEKIGSPASFYSVTDKAMPSYTLLVDFAVDIACFGGATSYLVVIADLMPDVMAQLGASDVAQERSLWVFIGFAIVAPLCFLRDMDSLKFTSTMSICFVMFLMLLIVLYSASIPGLDPCAGVDEGDTCVGDTVVATLDMNTFKVLSIFVFGFTCHQNIFGVTNELKDPTQPRVDIVILSSIGVSYCVYMIVAACGYHTFGDEVESDILVSYPKAYFTSLSRVLLSVAVAFTYPLQCHPCRNSVMAILDHWDAYRLGTTTEALSGTGSGASTLQPLLVREDKDEDDLYGGGGQRTTSTASTEPGQHLTERGRMIRFVAVTATFLGFSLLLALTVSDLSVVLALVGATGSTVMSYIVPGFAYYILFKDEGPVWKRNLALFLGCTGIVLVPLCLTFIFI